MKQKLVIKGKVLRELEEESVTFYLEGGAEVKVLCTI